MAILSNIIRIRKPTVASPLITSVVVTDSGYNNLDDTSIPASNAFIKIIGTSFTPNSNVFIGNVQVPSANVTWAGPTELRAVLPNITLGTDSTVSVFDSTGSGGIYASRLLSSGFPQVTQFSYVSGSQAVNTQLLATGDATLTYSLKAGSSLPAGLTLSANGLISGIATNDSTTSFTVLVNDAQQQTVQQDITLVVASVDPYFNYTTLLLQANESANNTTNDFFIDSSNNSFGLTSVGTNIQGSINPFGVGNWSNYFNNSSYLESGASANYAFGTGDFTIEAWLFNSGGGGWVATNRLSNGGANGTWQFTFGSDGKIYFGETVVGPSTAVVSVGTYSLNQWHHVAWVRRSGTLYLYVNGILDTSGASPTNFNNTSYAFRIGWNVFDAYWLGYISNLRIVKGSGVYTTNFTPSTSPLTAIANTVLLTCQSNRFIDNSNNAVGIGSSAVAVNRFNPFDVNANAYTTNANTSIGSTYYGSGYQTFPKPAFDSGDFSIEFWVYPTATGGSLYSDYFQRYAGDYGMYITFSSTSSNRFEVFARSNSNVGECNLTAGTGLSLNTWYHLAVCRTSGTLSLFLNGTRTSTAVFNQPYPNTQGGIGNNGSGTSYQGNSQSYGHISNFRIMTGESAYDARGGSCTVPTSPLTVTANTTLLTCTNTNSRIDLARGVTLSTAGTVTRSKIAPPTLYPAYTNTSTANTIYSGSVYFNGDAGGNYIGSPANSLDLGAGDFTCECWIYSLRQAAYNSNNYGIVNGEYNGSGVLWGLGISSYQGFRGLIFSYGQYGSFTTGLHTGNYLSANEWQHIAVTRSGSTIRIFVNGVSQTLTTYNEGATFNSATNFTNNSAGRSFGGGFIGYISNFRILKGIANYTSNFTPPTAPLQPIANTSFLVSGTNFAIYDATLQNNIQVVGNARVRTDVTKYGTGSMYFDGSSGYLLVLATPGLTLGTGNFTVEYWLYINSTAAQGVFGMRPQTTNGIYPVMYYSSGTLRYNVNGTDRISNSISINTWYHIAVSRSGSSTKMFIDGTQVGSTYTDTNNYLCSRLVIGADDYTLGNTPLSGYIDDFRITDGYARYTANFTPPVLGFNGQSRSV